MQTEEEYIEKIIEKTIPRHLWGLYEQLINGMKSGFYAGLKFEREKNKKKESVNLR